MFVIENALLVMLCIVGSVLFIDIFMKYLQNPKDPWMIALTSGEVNFQLASLIVCASLGFMFGYEIGISLPNETIKESTVIGCVFSAIASVICRGYVMLAFHRARSTRRLLNMYS